MYIRLAVGSGVAGVMLLGLVLGGCCKKPKSTQTDSTRDLDTLSDPAPTAFRKGTHFHFNRVPVEVDIPPGWNQTQNTRNWAVFRPATGGALAAFSPGTDCGAAERRFYGAMHELGLTNVVWEGGRKTLIVNGLSTQQAEGTATETSQLSYVKYAITKAPSGRGCLVTIYNVWKNKQSDYREIGERIFNSISLQ